MNDISKTLAVIGLEDSVEVWTRHWEASGHGYQPGNIFFLNSGFVTEQCRKLSMSDELCAAFLSALPMLRENPALERLAWHCYYLLSEFPEEYVGKLKVWPAIPEKVGTDAAMFYAVVYLAIFPKALARHRQRNISETITLEAWSELKRNLEGYREKHGVYGYTDINWFFWYVAGKLYPLGRLHHQLKCYTSDFHCFRNLVDGEVVVLAGDGMTFRDDGQFADADKAETLPMGTWKASYQRDEKGAEGFLMDPRGFATTKQILLSAERWVLIFEKNQPCSFFHIPPGSPMTWESCRESFEMADAFFKKHFPEFPIELNMCESWLFESQLRQLLKPTSNILKLQEQVYMLPLQKGNDGNLMKFVFGERPQCREKAPCDNSLRRAIAKHYSSGGILRCGACLFFNGMRTRDNNMEHNR